jgi:glycosyltransferase involved in cell wall biosynthesis
MSPNRHRVSVIIPTYNRSGVLRRAIRSVLDQDHAVHEVIVVDDCSAEDIGAVAGEFGAPVRHIRNAVNSGAQASRNAGLAAATGDVIAFLDSDDHWRPDKIRLQLERGAGQGELFCVTCGHSQYGSGPERVLRPPARIGLVDALVHNVVGPTSNILVSRPLFDRIGSFDPAMPACQDWELYIRILQHVPILAVPDHLVFQDTTDDARITRDRGKVVRGRRLLYEKARQSPGFRSLSASQRLMFRARQWHALARH